MSVVDAVLYVLVAACLGLTLSIWRKVARLRLSSLRAGYLRGYVEARADARQGVLPALDTVEARADDFARSVQ